MSITAKVHIEHDRLALVPTLTSLSEINIRVITQGNTDPGSTKFPFLIEYDDQDELEEMLDDDPTVETYDLIDWTEQQGIYYVEHSPETQLISTVVTDVGGFLVNTETKGSGWLVHLLLPDRDALNTIWEYTTEKDISLDIIEIYGNTDTDGRESYGLTDEQRDALQTAYSHGYFDEPRSIKLNEAADEMGLSSTAMSGRLRRGIRNLISTTIAEEKTEE